MVEIITLIVCAVYETIYHHNKEKKRDHYGIDIMHWDSRL